jgi:HK97 gp10 family phage protein
MMATVPSQFKIKGMDEVIEKLKGLPPKLQRKYLARALRAGTKPVKLEMVQRWKAVDNPKTPSRIYQYVSVRANAKLGRRNGGYALSVGMRGGARKPYVANSANKRKGLIGQTYESGSPVYYWRFLELGTKKLAARHISAQAFAASSGKAFDAIATDLDAGITEALGDNNAPARV